MDLSRLSLKPYKPLNHHYLLARSTKTKTTSVQESLLLWLLVSFTRRDEHLLALFKARHYFVHHFSSLKMPLSQDKTSNIQLFLLWKSFHMFVSDIKGRRHTIFHVWVNHRFLSIWFAFLTANECLLIINPLLLDTAKSLYHHWIWNWKWLGFFSCLSCIKFIPNFMCHFIASSFRLPKDSVCPYYLK